METQITDLFGLAIYTDKGMFIGEVDDVVIDVESKKIESLVVGKVNEQLFELKNYKGLKIPYRIISAIDDIVLIRQIFEKRRPFWRERWCRPNHSISPSFPIL
jgi:sporulation protein YlmC with PRC-barrel domain